MTLSGQLRSIVNSLLLDSDSRININTTVRVFVTAQSHSQLSFTSMQVLGRYQFNFAFENSIEDGYVTEKVFDALVSGTVPVYLGDAAHLKKLLPDPKVRSSSPCACSLLLRVFCDFFLFLLALVVPLFPLMHSTRFVLLLALFL
jgi:hypothetical protein